MGSTAAEFGRTLVCGFGRMGGDRSRGSWRRNGCGSVPSGGGPFQFGGVIYGDAKPPTRPRGLSSSATRAGCRSFFIQDVNGFDVGRDAERSGIIRRGGQAGQKPR